ncbi:MAG: efflux RND transporter periplasmic adaptor subunit [Gemmatimonadetes bacterium]|nr:efflux RND transporter periplasmic adaptor subunit [Gemmatimonadota bacterium]
MSAPTNPPAPRAVLSPGIIGAGVALVVIAAAATFFVSSRNTAAAKDERSAREREVGSGPLVRTAEVTPSAASRAISVLGEVHPYAAVTLYAKVSGYLASVSVDKGDHVKQGQVLAVVESPETDAAWSAAKAEADQREVTASRIRQLLAKKLVSPQESDQANADAAVAKERLSSLTQQREFEKLRAPFDGTVTARFADPGALMQNAANSQTSALPVVTVSDVSRLRLYAYLDQPDAVAVRTGLAATITSDEKPDLHLVAHVARTAGELDAKTRKLLVELDVDNRNGELLAGSFVHVQFDLPSKVLPELPVEALVVRQSKTQVPVLAADSTVHFKDVSVVYNDGKRIRVSSGVSAGETVVLNVGDSVAEGARVRPAKTATAGATR